MSWIRGESGQTSGAKLGLDAGDCFVIDFNAEEGIQESNPEQVIEFPTSISTCLYKFCSEIGSGQTCLPLTTNSKKLCELSYLTLTELVWVS